MSAPNSIKFDKLARIIGTASAPVTIVCQPIRNWRCKRHFLKLHVLNDDQLKDVGLTRGQLCHISSLPLSIDPVREAERLRRAASLQKLDIMR
jgi:uncharacterized protein YjiS (DUF1127 family)